MSLPYSKITFLLLFMSFVSCTSHNTEVKPKVNETKHVILIGSDGFGAYALFTRVRQAQSEEANWLNVGVADGNESISGEDLADSADAE